MSACPVLGYNKFNNGLGYKGNSTRPVTHRYTHYTMVALVYPATQFDYYSLATNNYRLTQPTGNCYLTVQIRYQYQLQNIVGY